MKSKGRRDKALPFYREKGKNFLKKAVVKTEKIIIISGIKNLSKSKYLSAQIISLTIHIRFAFHLDF